MGILKRLFKKNEYSELLTYVDFLIFAKKKQFPQKTPSEKITFPKNFYLLDILI